MEKVKSETFEGQLFELLERFKALDLGATAAGSYYSNRVDAIARQLEEKEFRITVVGEFSAGKSTFLNALIGRDVLPHALTETTSTVTYIRNVSAEDPRAETITVHFNNKQKPAVVFDLKENPAALKMYTTTQSAVNVAQEISHVEVYINFKNTDERVVFIDTPGLNGVADGHRDLTMHEIKQAHASICLFHLRSLANSNLEFLRILQKHQRSFLFVLNFIDEMKVSEGDSIEKKLTSFRDQLFTSLDVENEQSSVSMRTFGISALKALVAKDVTIPRLYSGDLMDVTPADRERLLQESLFPNFEESLWKDVLHGEKNQVFQHSLHLAFQTLLEEIQEELHQAKQFSQVQLDAKETDEVEHRLVQLEELSKRNWEKMTNYMISRQADLEKLLKEKIATDLEMIEEQIRERVSHDDFDAFELATRRNGYSQMVQSKTSQLSGEFHFYLSAILEEIYQSSIMRVKEYAPSVELDAEGTLTIKAVQFDGSNDQFEKQLISLQDKKIDFVVRQKELQEDQENLEKEIRQLELIEKKTQNKISQANLNQANEQNNLGREPEVRRWQETRYRTRERSKVSLFRLFGSSTYEEEYTTTVTDSSERDHWRQEKERIQTKYAHLKDSLQKESTELRLRKKQFETRASQFVDMLHSLRTKLGQIEEDLKRKQIEYEEVLLKARNEYLRSEKRRILEQVEKFLKNHVQNRLLESVKQNVDENMISIREQVQDFYEKNQAEAKRKLTMMLEAGKEAQQMQMAPYVALLNPIEQIIRDLVQIKLVSTRS